MAAAREERLSNEEKERQAALDLSWAKAQEDLADPDRRAILEAALENVDTDAPRLTRAEFLLRSQ